MTSTSAFSALSHGLPPSLENAPPTINIDLTCALFALEVECRKMKIKNESTREIPRLYRILGLPLTPRATRSFSFSSSTYVSSTSATSFERNPPRESNKEVPRSSNATGDVDYYGPFSTRGFSGKPWVKKEPFPSIAFGIRANSMRQPNATTDENGCGWSSTNVHATVPTKKQRMPRGYLDTSTLSAEQKIIRRPAPKPAPKPSVDDTLFSDSISGNVARHLPAASHTFSNAPAFSNEASRTAPWRRGNTIPPPIQSHRRDMGLASFVAVTYPDEIVELHRRRIYPSSTEPESNWCVGETIEYVRRRDLYPYDTVKPVVKTSTVKVGSPRPVSVNRYRETQKWLQSLETALAAD
ncbi:hypothetical protein E1B28_003549 [Marasmius oreades]|uniref:Uncharacterized protein n=1 Tax=Marasmius oreades TaxID=181124 RepID=A0A9P7UK09_9AGAR|nr:uncharacterized protein E1B28_003549 [Marasmius oreades]KAG7086027.1 hypothetical protein E1B28_003549 [Marasmius oreades]